MNETKPWQVEDEKELGRILSDLLETLRFVSILLYPFMPATAEKIFEQIGLEKAFSFDDLRWGYLERGMRINRGELLFRKIKA